MNSKRIDLENNLKFFLKKEMPLLGAWLNGSGFFALVDILPPSGPGRRGGSGSVAIKADYMQITCKLAALHSSFLSALGGRSRTSGKFPCEEAANQRMRRGDCAPIQPPVAPLWKGKYLFKLDANLAGSAPNGWTARKLFIATPSTSIMFCAVKHLNRRQLFRVNFIQLTLNVFFKKIEKKSNNFLKNL